MPVRTMFVLILITLCCALSGQDWRKDWNFVPPAGVHVENVRTHGAVGDGIADDTEAIRAAVRAAIDVSRYRANPFVYLPNGTYKVTGPIEGRKGKVGDWSAGWLSMMLLIGESRDGAVIRLADRAEGYGDPAKPRWVLACGSEGDKRDNEAGGGNRAFRHGFYNLTVDVGHGNPGAIAIDFMVNNRGGIEHVTVRAPEGSGHTGIGLTRWWPGPAWIGDVLIDGFDAGFRLDHYQYGMTFERIAMRNQRKIGITNTNNVLGMRRVDFEGNVPFYRGTGGHAMLSLLDSRIVATSPQDNAISTAGIVNLRRVDVTGFKRVIHDSNKDGRNHLDAQPQGVTRVASHDFGRRFAPPGQEVKALDLPIEDDPVLRPGPKDTWIDGGTSGSSLQAAIDGGAQWILVRGSIPVTETIVLRNRVRLIMGLHGHLKRGEGFDGKTPMVRVENGATPAVAIEHMCIDGRIENASSRTFALRHGDLGSFHGSGPGKTFIVDVIGKGYLIGPKHQFWARQLNAEFGSDYLLTNEGQAWIMGFKMETSPSGSKDAPNSTPSLLNRNGGRLEVFAGLLYTLGSRPEHAPKVPAFTNEGGQIAISFRNNGRPETWYKQLLQVSSGDTMQSFNRDKIGGHGQALVSDSR